MLLASYDCHKLIYRLENRTSGLKGFIAIHNNTLGPATGGTRMMMYAGEEEALEDALRLSRAMTYKCALAGVPYGGGKAVIIGDLKKDKNEILLRAYAEEVNNLHGLFTTGEDVGITEDDVQLMMETSSYFNGKNGLAGDPAPFAALGVYRAMRAASKFVFGTDELRGRTVGIKGVGKVGKELVMLLVKDGAAVTVSDINPDAIVCLRKQFPTASYKEPKDLFSSSFDIYAPCALGREFTDENILNLRSKIVCGGANNQLEHEGVGDGLYGRGIVYIPDYVANAGGLINVVDEREEGGYSRERVMERVQNIGDTVRTILFRSRECGTPPHRIANEMAEQRLSNGS